jgi:hypothetical protein
MPTEMTSKETDMSERGIPARTSGWREWRVPVAFIALCADPVAAHRTG